MKCLCCGSTKLKKIRTNYIYSNTGFKELFEPCTCVECKRCGLIQLNMDEDIESFAKKLDGYYSMQYRTDNKNILNEESKKWYLNRANAIANIALERYGKEEYLNVFELGAGYGLNLNYFKSVFKNSKIATYESNSVVTNSLKEYGIDNKPIDSFTDESLDYIILSHVLEHLIDPVETINQCIAKLKSGGLLYIEVPNNPKWSARYFEPHITFWNENSFRKFFEINFKDSCELFGYGIYTTGATLPISMINSMFFTSLKKHNGETEWYKNIEHKEKERVSVSEASKSLDFSVPTKNGIFLKMILEKR